MNQSFMGVLGALGDFPREVVSGGVMKAECACMEGKSLSWFDSGSSNAFELLLVLLGGTAMSVPDNVYHEGCCNSSKSARQVYCCSSKTS